MSKWFYKIIIFFSILCLIFISGCSGCSQSGIRDNQQKKNYSNTKKPTKNVKSVKDSKEKESKERNYIPNNKVLPLNELYNKYKSSVFIIYTSDGVDGYQGTGFFISKSGIAISNYHVFKGTSKGLEEIETSDGHKLKIDRVLSKSDENDFIIFKVRLSGYIINNPIPIANEVPLIGEDVFAIGNPLGLESTLSKGIISGFREGKQLIQTTTEITHGSSGGPLLNMRGEVVGITSAGLGEANLNFAVNIKYLPLDEYNLGK
jgi:serine protease Do